jgi:hypothetical protein
MVNYQQGKIYMIESLSQNKRYYGSTTSSLSIRMAGHRHSNTCYKLGKGNLITSFEILDYGDASIILVANAACNTKEELHAVEAVYIRNNDCVNKNMPYRSPEEKKEQRKIYNNKEEIKEKKKLFYQTDKAKETANTYAKIYRSNHKNEKKEYAKLYYQNNLIKTQEEVECIYCEKKMTRRCLSKHNTTKTHILNYINF